MAGFKIPAKPALVALFLTLNTIAAQNQGPTSKYGSQCPQDIITTETTISSPLYPVYATFWRCGYNIKAPIGMRVLITFEDFDMRQNGNTPILYTDQTVCNSNTGDSLDFVEVWKDSHRDASTKYVGTELKGKQLLSKDNQMKLMFQTMTRKDAGGFLAKVEFVDKDQTDEEDLDVEFITNSGMLNISSSELSKPKQLNIQASLRKVVQISIGIDTDASLGGCEYVKFTFENVSTMYQEEGNKQWSKCDSEAVGKRIQSSSTDAVLTISPQKTLPEKFTIFITIKFVTPTELCGGVVDMEDEISIPRSVIEAKVGQPLLCIWTSQLQISTVKVDVDYTVRASGETNDYQKMCYIGASFFLSDSDESYECGEAKTNDWVENDIKGTKRLMIVFFTDIVTDSTSFTVKLTDIHSGK